MMRNAGFVSVKKAAVILDVAPNTIRAWGKAGKIPEYRHPANNYRLYKKNELEKLLQQLFQFVLFVKPIIVCRMSVFRNFACFTPSTNGVWCNVQYHSRFFYTYKARISHHR